MASKKANIGIPNLCPTDHPTDQDECVLTDSVFDKLQAEDLSKAPVAGARAGNARLDQNCGTKDRAATCAPSAGVTNANCANANKAQFPASCTGASQGANTCVYTAPCTTCWGKCVDFDKGEKFCAQDCAKAWGGPMVLMCLEKDADNKVLPQCLSNAADVREANKASCSEKVVEAAVEVTGRNADFYKGSAACTKQIQAMRDSTDNQLLKVSFSQCERDQQKRRLAAQSSASHRSLRAVSLTMKVSIPKTARLPSPRSPIVRQARPLSSLA